MFTLPKAGTNGNGHFARLDLLLSALFPIFPGALIQLKNFGPSCLRVKRVSTKTRTKMQ